MSLEILTFILSIHFTVSEGLLQFFSLKYLKMFVNTKELVLLLYFKKLPLLREINQKEEECIAYSHLINAAGSHAILSWLILVTISKCCLKNIIPPQRSIKLLIRHLKLHKNIRIFNWFTSTSNGAQLWVFAKLPNRKKKS